MKVSKEVSEYMAKIGAKGGKKRKLTPEEARAMVKKRWDKRNTLKTKEEQK